MSAEYGMRVKPIILCVGLYMNLWSM